MAELSLISKGYITRTLIDAARVTKGFIFAYVLFFAISLLIGCGEPNLDDPKVREKILMDAIDENSLQSRQSAAGEELHYAPNQEKPYTGWVKRDRSLQQFQRGEPNGTFITWHASGQTSEKVTFKDGKLHGVGIEYYENGQKRSEVTYKNGNLDGLWIEWYENGQKRSDGQYQIGKKDGLWTLWHANGQKQREGSYKNGKEDGLWTEWNENGEMLQNSTLTPTQPERTE